MIKKGVFVPISINYKFSNVLGFTLHSFNNFDAEKPLKIHSQYLVRVILLSVLMFIPYIQYLQFEFQKPSTTLKLLALVCGLRVFGCSGVLISSLRNQMYLIQATQRLNQVDEELVRLGEKISYKNHTKLLLTGCSLLCSCVICYRTIIVIFGEPFWPILMDLFIVGYPFLILSISTFYLMFFLFVVRTRFVALVSIVKKNRRRMTSPDEKGQLKMFLAITRIYSNLFSCSECINKFVSLASFICVMCNLLEGMLTVNLIYQGEGGFRQVYSVVTYLWLTMATLLAPMFVEEMPGKLCRILTGIEILDSHMEMRAAKNTFLYQALHTKIEFSVCGMFPMSMSSLPEQFSFCISLVLVMYTIAG